LLQAPEGSFAAAWDDAGDALYAARWLHEQMPDAQAIIMATVPGQEEHTVRDVQSVFPGVPVYGRSATQAKEWVTLSHLGSSEQGISLIGISPHIGFGAAEATPSGSMDVSAAFMEAYDAAFAEGSLKSVVACIVTCRGCITDLSFIDSLRDRISNIPLLALASGKDHKSSAQDQSIGIMMFGERHPVHEMESTAASKMACLSEEDTASGSTAWPTSPATEDSIPESASTEHQSCQ
jgi:hypothetical protein